MHNATATILLTRPEAGARAFARALSAAGVTAPVTVAPLLAIVPLDPDGEPGATAPWPDAGVIFTSAHAVAAHAALTPARPVAWCVGDATAAAARAAGYPARSAAGDAAALVRMILSAEGAGRGPLVHARGREARGGIAEKLAAAGIPVREVVVYDQVARPLGVAGRALLSGAGAVVMPVFSPRSARLAGQAAADARAALHPVAISAAAARAWQGTGAPGHPPLVADRPDAAAMVAAVRRALHAAAAG